MQVYSKFSDAVNSIDINITYWEYPKTDNIFDRNAMLYMADQFDLIFNEEGSNYYMTLHDGKIKLILTEEDQLMTIFAPVNMPESWQGGNVVTGESLAAAEPQTEQTAQPSIAAAAQPALRFCPKCGNPRKEGASFCGKCGCRLK